jgi:glutamate--cysteine ligase
MMKRTATVQANFDWHNEADLAASARTALAVAPLVSALFASAPFYEGRPSGAVSERQLVWADTDQARSGYPQVMLDDDFSYERYVEWVVSVPMYFIRRDGIHHDVAGASFRSFMREGLVVDGVRMQATLRDFSDHLTTIFPEVRIKRVLEVRAADSGPLPRLCALPALYKGLLYDGRARDDAWALMETPTSAELHRLRADVARQGMAARHRGQPVSRLCERLVDIADSGLSRLNERDAEGRSEAVFLEPLVATVQSGKTYAEALLDRWREGWHGSLKPLWAELDLLGKGL